MKPVPDPARPGNTKLEPAGEGLSAADFAAQVGKPGTDGPVTYRVSNPGDKTVKLTLRLERPFPANKTAEMVAEARKDAKPGAEAQAERDARNKPNPNLPIYFTITDSTSVVSTKIPPDAKRDAEDQPFDVVLDYNRKDSGRSWLKGDAGTLYGWYTGMAYLLPIIGGLIADKLIGTHRSMVVGGLLIALGHVVLGLSGMGTMALSPAGMSVFVGGLALITIGTGHFKPSVSVMVGQLYAPGDPRRESAFSVFYTGINVGAFTCNLVCATLAASYGWHYGFAAAAVGMLLGLGLYLWGRPRYLAPVGEPAGPHGGTAWFFLPIGVALAALIGYLFHMGVLGLFDDFVSNPFVFWTLLVGALAYAAWFILSQLPGDRGPVATIFVYMLFNAVFWLAFEQAGASLNTFTEESTSRVVGPDGWRVPTGWFQSVNPALIILLAPIFGIFWASLLRRGKSIPQPAKIGLGLIFVGIGYIVMALAATRLNAGISKVSMIYICGCYFFHTVGEIILSPTGLSYVAKTAPRRHVSSLMGIWFISSFVAGLLAGKLSSLVDPIIEGDVKLPWNFGGQTDFFVLFVITSFSAGFLIFAATPLLLRLQRSRQD
jgi:POT family proton-dependent oligopeptide transporter